MTMLNAPHFQSPEAARVFLENARWPDGPVCPHCGSIDKAYARKRPGLYRCAEKECRKDFTVTTKSVIEASHVPLHLWLQAFYLMCSSKKGVSALQISRTLKITYKSAWFLCHRIREAMRTGGLLSPMGGAGQIVEADETYFGEVENPRKKRTSGERFIHRGKKRKFGGPANKRGVLSLVERGGKVRSFHVPTMDKDSVMKIVCDNIDFESRLHTDESKLYHGTINIFAEHGTVKHTAKEYVYGDIHTNSAEGFFSIFKRGMKGVYQHCSEKHLHRYLAEFDFRYNNRIALGTDDGERAARAVMGAAGKRLTYRQSH